MSVRPVMPWAVSLPMYLSQPDALQALWSHLAGALARHGLQALPDRLQWPSDLHQHWQDPNLLLSQACGYPLVTFLSGKVRVVGTFRYTAAGCSGYLCRSALVVRAGDRAQKLADLRGRILAFNSTDSQSGYNALRAKIAPLGSDGRFFSAAVPTGSHVQSLKRVSQGLADLAALDCVTLAGLQISQPELCRSVRVLDWSDPYPGLPLITSGQTSDQTLGLLRQVLAQAMEAPELGAVRDALLIGGFVPLNARDYARCHDMRETAQALGCTQL